MHRREVIANLVKKNNWTFGAEIGLWDGRTFIWLLRHCPNLTMLGVDAWEPQGIYQGIDKDGNTWDHEKHEKTVREKAREFGHRAIVVKEDSEYAADDVEMNSLDFVFIDADHTTAGVMRDILAWWPKMKPEGKLMGHDIDWPEVKRALKNTNIQYDVLDDNVWIER